MPFSRQHLALLATLSLSVDGAIGWVKGTNLCAGLQECETADFGDSKKCSTVLFAKCDADPATTAPLAENIVETWYEGMAIANIDEYWKDEDVATNLQVWQPMPPKSGNPQGYRDFVGEMDVSSAFGAGAKYAYMQTGRMYESPDKTAQLYLGIANYVNIGSKTLKTTTNDFFIGEVDSSDSTKQAAPKDRSSKPGSQLSESAHGAPKGPFSVCVSPNTAAELFTGSTKCGAEVSYPPDATKFSLYMVSEKGWATGAKYNFNIGSGGDKIHFGARMRMRLHKDTKVKANGMALPKGGEKPLVLSTLDLTFKDGTNWGLTFPKLGNWGVSTSYTPSSADQTKVDASTSIDGPAVSGSKAVKINIRRDESVTTHTELVLDYLVQVDEDFKKADYFFVYDPTLQKQAAVTPNTDGASATALSAAALMIAASLHF